MGRSVRPPIRPMFVLAWFDGFATLTLAIWLVKLKRLGHWSLEIDEAMQLISDQFQEVVHKGEYAAYSAQRFWLNCRSWTYPLIPCC